MFEVKINENQIMTFSTPNEAVTSVADHLALDLVHRAPLFHAIASLGSGSSFIDHDSGVVVTALY